jgi:thymidylate synthase (FAD)
VFCLSTIPLAFRIATDFYERKSNKREEEAMEKCDRSGVAALDEILGQPFKVLNDGFIRVVDYLGSDDAIVQAARVSYGKGTKRISEDRALIRYLMRHWHTTPFEMCEIKFHVRVPMDCWRQWIRHRTANVNEYSTRYSEAIDAAQKTEPDGWRTQSSMNRQGSEGIVDPTVGAELTREEAELHRLSREIYEGRLKKDVAREQARKDLPLSTFTEAYWKIDLHNLLHFLRLRMDDHAQLEIRSYATIIGNEIVSRWCPIAWEAFSDYRLSSLSLSRIEVEVIKALVGGRPSDAVGIVTEAGFLSKDGKPVGKNRERHELEEKLASLGFSIPWKTE